MEYDLIIPKHLDKLFSKLSKKNKIHFTILSKKIKLIMDNPKIGKPLTANMIGQRRIHVGKSFVLVFPLCDYNVS